MPNYTLNEVVDILLVLANITGITRMLHVFMLIVAIQFINIEQVINIKRRSQRQNPLYRWKQQNRNLIIMTKGS